MIVITAASGKLGRAAAEALSRIVSPEEIRLAARSVEKIDDLKTGGFTVVKGDYDDPASLDRAFDGADKILLISSMGPNDVRIRQHETAVAAAVRADVSQVVYTSTVNPVPGSRFVWAEPHVKTEAHLKASGIPHTILRDNPYAANLDELILHAVKEGSFALPGVETGVAYVTHQDIARAAAEVLTGEGHIGKTYELTGPSAVTGIEIAGILSEIMGREVKAVDAPLESFEKMFRSMGLPEFVVEGVTSFYGAAAAGEYSRVSGDIEAITGRAATPLRSYIETLLDQRK